MSNTIHIFLDIDGVLNSHEFYKKMNKAVEEGRVPPDYVQIDEVAVSRLNNILNAIDKPVVILSSTWRYAPGFEETERHLRNHGFQYKLDGKTGYPPRYRHTEILDHVEAHDVERYIILDDDVSDDVYECFKTNMAKGLTDEIRDRVIKRIEEMQCD